MSGMPTPLPHAVAEILRIFGLVFPSVIFLSYETVIRKRFYKGLASRIHENLDVDGPVESVLREGLSEYQFRYTFLIIVGNALLLLTPPHPWLVALASVLLGGLVSWRAMQLSRRDPADSKAYSQCYKLALVLLGIVAAQAIGLASGALLQDGLVTWIGFGIPVIVAVLIAVIARPRKFYQPSLEW